MVKPRQIWCDPGNPNFNLKSFSTGGQHLEDKSNLLKQSLQQELLKEVRSKNERAQRLELLISLREASEGVRDILEENLNSVDISYVDISVSDMYAIGTLLRFSKRVTKLKLAACGITSAVLQAVERSSRGSEIQVIFFQLSAGLTKHFNSMIDLKGESMLEIDFFDGLDEFIYNL